MKLSLIALVLLGVTVAAEEQVVESSLVDNTLSELAELVEDAEEDEDAESAVASSRRRRRRWHRHRPHRHWPHGHRPHRHWPHGHRPHRHWPHGHRPHHHFPHGHRPHHHIPHGHRPHHHWPHGHRPHHHWPHGHRPHGHLPLPSGVKKLIKSAWSGIQDGFNQVGNSAYWKTFVSVCETVATAAYDTAKSAAKVAQEVGKAIADKWNEFSDWIVTAANEVANFMTWLFGEICMINGDDLLNLLADMTVWGGLGDVKNAVDKRGNGDMNLGIVSLACSLAWLYLAITFPFLNAIVALVAGLVKACKAFGDRAPPVIEMSLGLVLSGSLKWVSVTFCASYTVGMNSSADKYCGNAISISTGFSPIPKDFLVNASTCVGLMLCFGSAPPQTGWCNMLKFALAIDLIVVKLDFNLAYFYGDNWMKFGTLGIGTEVCNPKGPFAFNIMFGWGKLLGFFCVALDQIQWCDNYWYADTTHSYTDFQIPGVEQIPGAFQEMTPAAIARSGGTLQI